MSDLYFIKIIDDVGDVWRINLASIERWEDASVNNGEKDKIIFINGEIVEAPAGSVTLAIDALIAEYSPFHANTLFVGTLP
jgi:hypothetical protein